jgi:hypothetical protein
VPAGVGAEDGSYGGESRRTPGEKINLPANQNFLAQKTKFGSR